MVSSECPSRERLLAFALGRLPDQDSDAIADHLDQCVACESVSATLDGVTDTLVDLLREGYHQSKSDEEPECQQAIARIKTIRVGDSTIDSNASRTDGTEPTILGSLGEYELLEKLGRRRDGGRLQGPAHQAQATRGAQGAARRHGCTTRGPSPALNARWKRSGGSTTPTSSRPTTPAKSTASGSW